MSAAAAEAEASSEAAKRPRAKLFGRKDKVTSGTGDPQPIHEVGERRILRRFSGDDLQFGQGRGVAGVETAPEIGEMISPRAIHVRYRLPHLHRRRAADEDHSAEWAEQVEARGIAGFAAD